MTLISLLLLAALLPYLSHSAYVNVGIINGTEAKPHSRPYMVSLQGYGRHHCGGFLVSDQFVMTAAHCQLKQKLTAVLGAHDLSKKKEKGSICMKVKSEHPHPQFHITNEDYDFMLLKLRKPVKKSKTIDWISIPQTEGDVLANSECSAAGWGQTGSDKSASERLLETKTKTVDRTTCNNLWANLIPGITLTPRMVCAVHPGGVCMGDSGGPLVCNNTAVGIVSFGQGNKCESPDVPNVYARISAVLPWIKSIMRRV